MRHRYPFEALHWLRQQRVERKARALGESAERTVSARSAAARAEAARRSAEQVISSLAAAEGARLNEGLARASDLQLSADWHKARAAELAVKAEQESRARVVLATEAAAEAAARRALSLASNEAKLIDAHRDAYRAQRAAEQELSEEEAAAEQWTARHFSSRRG